MNSDLLVLTSKFKRVFFLLLQIPYFKRLCKPYVTLVTSDNLNIGNCVHAELNWFPMSKETCSWRRRRRQRLRRTKNTFQKLFWIIRMARFVFYFHAGNVQSRKNDRKKETERDDNLSKQNYKKQKPNKLETNSESKAWNTLTYRVRSECVWGRETNIEIESKL